MPASEVADSRGAATRTSTAADSEVPCLRSQRRKEAGFPGCRAIGPLPVRHLLRAHRPRPGQRHRGAEQRAQRRAGGEMALCRLHRPFLIEVGRRDPLVQTKGGAGSVEDGAAVDDMQGGVHA